MRSILLASLVGAASVSANNCIPGRENRIPMGQSAPGSKPEFESSYMEQEISIGTVRVLLPRKDDPRYGIYTLAIKEGALKKRVPEVGLVAVGGVAVLFLIAPAAEGKAFIIIRGSVYGLGEWSGRGDAVKARLTIGDLDEGQTIALQWENWRVKSILLNGKDVKFEREDVLARGKKQLVF